MRKLATIAKIDKILPISDADAIELAIVGGWQAVVNKGKYSVNDLVVYCEVDSWVPTELAGFLSKGKEPNEYNGVKGERLRTVRLRGQLSQGLVLPLGVLPDGCEATIGDDVSSILGIQKYEPPVPAQLAGTVKGTFPSKTRKTDQERVQNLLNDLPNYYDTTFEVTEKLEGSSCQFGLIDDEFLVCSRNLNLLETPDNSMWKQVRRYDVEAKMRQLGLHGCMIQTEIVGEGIQGNHYKLKGQDIYVYDIYDTVQGVFLSSSFRRILCEKLGLKHVPSISYVHLGKFVYNLDPLGALLLASDGQSQINQNVLREGIVFKSLDAKFSFKVVSNKYLLKTGG